MSEHFPPHIAIIGLGLIGSSIARGLQQSNASAIVSASDRNPLALHYALERGFIRHAAKSAAEAAEYADIIVLATPPSSLADIAEQLRGHLKPGAVITDTASVKQAVIDAVTEHLPENAIFVPGHPIAGSEQSGVAAGRADLFVGKRVTLTPLTPESPGIPEVTALWQSLGAKVEYMPADIHDRIYAYVSHLPQWLAFALKSMLEPYFPLREQLPNFRRFTRLCGSDPVLWRDIFSANRRNLEEAIARFMVVQQQIRGELAGGAEENAAQAVDEQEIYTKALPGIIASCLISTVYQEERASGFRFARYAGTGFADFTAPATEDTDKQLEFISLYPGQVAGALERCTEALTQRIVTKD